MKQKRYAFILSDGTGITAENLANSLLNQFEQISFEKITLPYIDTVIKAREVAEKINRCYEETSIKPLVFMTLLHPEIVQILKCSQARVFDLFNTFLGPLEHELEEKSSYHVGRTHGVANPQAYIHRIEAIEYAMAHDDGIRIQGFNKAEVILVGVSRCGKTPSCIYLALHFGVIAANYPLTDDDLLSPALPASLKPYRQKLFGLTIEPHRLHDIRTARRPQSQYASLQQCKKEIKLVESLFQQEKIPYLDSTYYSIEEITTKILSIMKIKRALG